MSSGSVFPPHSGSIDPQQLCGDVTASIVSTGDWYPATTYSFPEHFSTPYSTTTLDSHHASWNNSYSRSSAPDLPLATYAVQQHQQQMQQQQQQQQPQQPQHSSQQQPQQQQQSPALSQHQSTPQPQQQQLSQQPPQSQHQNQQHAQQQALHSRDPDRPRSSPSTFGPSESVPWMNAFGIQYTTAAAAQTPLSTAFPPTVFQNGPLDMARSDIHQPQPRRSYPSIAPNPQGVAAKRKREEDDSQQQPLHDVPAFGGPGATPKTKRRRTPSVVSNELSEEDRFLVQLKEEENLPWKDIATRFQTDKGRGFNVAALQMRYKRLREKYRVWEEQDLEALKLAYEHWEKFKWDIISSKVQEKWPPRHCARKWQELEAASATHLTGAAQNPGLTPALTQFSSPIEGPVHFAFMPLQ